MQRAILRLSAAGTLLFGLAFSLSFLNPRLVEYAMRAVVRLQVEQEVRQRVDVLSGSGLVRLAQRALGQNREQAGALRERLRAGLPERVAAGVADMLDPGCPCRQLLANGIRALPRIQLDRLDGMQARLTGLIHAAYAEVASKLLREFRIFTGANALAFVALGGIALARPRAERQLGLAALALAGAVVYSGGLYLFGQDWLHAILFSDYLGFAYAGYLAAVAGLMADVLLNRARITSRMLSIVGAGAVGLPC